MGDNSNGKVQNGGAGTANGAPVIEPGSPLTRLNYFDGKLLRAKDLALEQSYLRTMVALSNQAGGDGVAYGYDLARTGGDRLTLKSGLAIDAAGRLLLLSQDVDFSIAQLITQGQRLASASPGMSASMSMSTSLSTSASATFGDCAPAAATTPPTASGSADLYLVCLGHAEDYCGQEDIYGAICQPACSQGTERPYVVEGIVVLVVPLALALGALPKVTVPVGRDTLRSQVASAYFAREAAEVGSLISATGLKGGLFCLGSQLGGGACVPIGVLDRRGGVTTFVDPWIARRERIEAPARRYWAWRMAMRPWDVFLAQVLQFQCQLPAALTCIAGQGGGDSTDPCAGKTQVIGDVATAVAQAHTYLAAVAEKLKDAPLSAALRTSLQLGKVGEWVSSYGQLQQKITDAQKIAAAADNLLVRCNIIELPSAGYLPVVPTSNASLNGQVRALLGEGVDLRFCVVRPDYVPHALETAQHMERISLLQGLADPADKPRVDILVPDGQLVSDASQTVGAAFDATLVGFETITTTKDGAPGSVAEPVETLEPTGGTLVRSLMSALSARGVARGEVRDDGAAFYFAGAGRTGDALRKGGVLQTGPTDVNPPAVPVDYKAPDIQVSPYAEVVAAAARRLVRNRMAERPLDDATKVYETRVDGLSGAYVDNAQSADVQAVWLSLRIGANPLALGPGDTTTCAGRMLMVVPSAKPVIDELTFAGELRVREQVARAGATRLAGVLRGDATFRVGGVRKAHALNVPVTLIQKGDGGAGALEVTLPLRSTETVVVRLAGGARWKGAPTLAIGTVEITETLIGARSNQGSNQATLAIGERMNLREDPDVMTPGNPRRSEALQGLDILEAVLDEPGFRASAERALFPAAVSDTSETLIRPTADWVLFHRRRESSCDCCGTQSQLTLKTRTYRLYVVDQDRTAKEQQLATLDYVRKVRTPFLKDEIPRFGPNAFQEVGLVEFEGGTDRLLTPGAALLQMVRATRHGSAILYAAVASQGEARSDGDMLASNRLANLEDNLQAELTVPDSPAARDVLDTVPRYLSAANADGVMILVTSTAELTVVTAAPPPPPPPPAPVGVSHAQPAPTSNPRRPAARKSAAPSAPAEEPSQPKKK